MSTGVCSLPLYHILLYAPSPKVRRVGTAGTWRRQSHDPFYADRVVLSNGDESLNNGADPPVFHSFTPTPINFPRRQPMVTTVPKLTHLQRVHRISTWRLKWVVLLLVCITLVQAIMLGRQIEAAQGLVGGASGCGDVFKVNVGIFLALLAALWALLSQIIHLSHAGIVGDDYRHDEDRPDEPITVSMR